MVIYPARYLALASKQPAGTHRPNSWPSQPALPALEGQSAGLCPPGAPSVLPASTPLPRFSLGAPPPDGWELPLEPQEERAKRKWSQRPSPGVTRSLRWEWAAGYAWGMARCLDGAEKRGGAWNWCQTFVGSSLGSAPHHESGWPL